MTGLRFDHVWKYFDDGTPAVADLCLEVKAGEFLVMVGPSGCGKTTSLRMLAGLERPSHGRIWANDVDITDVPPGGRDVSMVFQSYALYPHMSIRRNLTFGPKIRKDPKAGIDQRVEAAADLLGIKHLLDRRPSALSGGERQRVALGRAMVRDPKYFLMDEPLSNLDAALRVQMRAELIRLHARLEKTTTVYVTHDQVEALTMGDRVAVLKNGRLLQVDTPLNLYENPNTRFVATFVGSPKMNVLPGSVRSEGDTLKVQCAGTSFGLSPEQASNFTGTRESDVLVGIRPADLRPVDVGTPEEHPKISGRVDVVEHTGAEQFVTIRNDEHLFISRFPRTHAPQQDEVTIVTFDPCDVYLFDLESETSVLDRTVRHSDVSQIISQANEGLSIKGDQLCHVESV